MSIPPPPPPVIKREGWKIGAKRVYRLYDEENLKVRSVERKKIARRQRVPQAQASGPNQCWSADFVSDKLTDGRTIRILTVIDQFTRECVWLEADRSSRSLFGPGKILEVIQGVISQFRYEVASWIALKEFARVDLGFRPP